MPKALRHHRRAHVCLLGHGGVEVSEAAQGGSWAFRTFRQPSDGVHDRVRVLPVVPVSPRENDAWRLRFEFPRDFLLICAVLPQNLSCQLIQVHVPLSPCRFGRFQRNTVGGYHQGWRTCTTPSSKLTLSHVSANPSPRRIPVNAMR